MGIVGPKSMLDSRKIGDLRGAGIFDLKLLGLVRLESRRELGALHALSLRAVYPYEY